MGRLRKQGESGTAAQYFTRGQALRKLQVSLPDFRRLCILKGIYPRDPKKKASGRDKTYYHKKDIGFLLHEPLLNKFRDMKVFLRQHKRLVARHEQSRAMTLEGTRPVMSLDHLVRERYPSFVDALQDIDDALTLVHLFAYLPLGTTSFHTSKVPEQCLNICREFQTYIAREHCLRKVFVSVKGIYHQAVVNGETITWIVPHNFAQTCPDDVDYKVMLTFVDFYLTLLRFVNFKLYHEIGFVYPPQVDEENHAKGHLLSSIILTKANNGNDADSAAIDPEFETTVSDADAPVLPFTDCVFLLSREVPADVLEMIIVSGGGSAIREQDVTAENADSITHQVVDRPALSGVAHPNREYIQPQWVFDSFNMKACLPVHPYGVGQALPPHLSPFVDDESEGYVPTHRKVLEEWANKDKAVLGAAAADTLMGDVDENEAESSSDDEEGEGEAASDEEEEVVVVAAPASAPRKKRTRSETAASRNDDEDVEAKELAKIMMTNKTKRLYSRMQYGINEKKAKNDVLEAKRRKIETSSTSSGKKSSRKHN